MIQGPDNQQLEQKSTEPLSPNGESVSFSLEKPARAPLNIWLQFGKVPHFIELLDSSGYAVMDNETLTRNEYAYGVLKAVAGDEVSEAIDTVSRGRLPYDLSQVDKQQARKRTRALYTELDKRHGIDSQTTQALEFLNRKLLEIMIEYPTIDDIRPIIAGAQERGHAIAGYKTLSKFLEVNDVLLGTDISLNGRKYDLNNRGSYVLSMRPIPKTHQGGKPIEAATRRRVINEQEMTLLIQNSSDPGEIFHLLPDADNYRIEKIQLQMKAMLIVKLPPNSRDEAIEGLMSEIKKILSSRQGLIEWLKEDPRTQIYVETAEQGYKQLFEDMLTSIRKINRSSGT